jgi:hypothetical protein
MAKGKRTRAVVQYVQRSAGRARAAAPIVIRQAAHAAKRSGKAVAGAAYDEKHMLIAVVAAAALGYAQKTMTIPTIPMIGTSGTVGLVAFVGAKMTKNRMLRHAATGFLCIAAHEYAKTGVVSGDVLGGRGAAWE